MARSIRIYKSDIKENQRFKFYRRNIPAGAHYSLHWHDFLEFEIVTSGTGRHVHNGSTYIVKGGSAYLMHYCDFHSLTALTDMTVYNIHFEENMLSRELLNHLKFNGIICDFSIETTNRIIEKFNRISLESDGTLPFKDMIIRNILSEIVIEMIRMVSPTEAQPTPLPVQQAVAHINSNFRSRLTLDELADTLSFSPNYLGQLFKSQTGSTFNEYINTLRLKYACQLLTATDLTVKEVAFQSGYSSTEYFLYIFKKKTMMTPCEYRNQNK